MRRLARRLGEERGQALIEGLLALGLVLLVVAFAAEAITYAHARNVAQAAAQDGARAAAAGGTQAGIDRANAILAAAGFNFHLLLRWLERFLRAWISALLGESPGVLFG